MTLAIIVGAALLAYWLGYRDGYRDGYREADVASKTAAFAQELARLKESGVTEVSPGVFVADKSTSIFREDDDILNRTCDCDAWQSCPVCREDDEYPVECVRCNNNGCVHCQGD